MEPYPEDLREAILGLSQPGINEIDRLGAVDRQIADVFAKAALTVIGYAAIGIDQVAAIGSHGQTVRHRPNETSCFTLQIGDPNRIAELTGVLTVADFRRRDMAAGGQGAPLAPAFHRAAFGIRGNATAVVNILLENAGVDPSMLAASGRSEYHPVDAPDKAKTRRIEVILAPNLDSLYELIAD